MLFRSIIFIFIVFQNSVALAKCNFNTIDYIDEINNPKNIKLIKIDTPKSQRYVRNFLQTYSSVIEGGFILPKYKKRFFAKINVIYDFGECNFEGKIRQSGDWPDHIKIKKGNPLRSLDISLSKGNILNVVKFKLLIPETRYNSNEILGSLILNELGFISPETFQVFTKVNGITNLMLFQEKAEKELLERNFKREGPIFEGDESLIWGYKDYDLFELADVSLSKMINEKWFTKGKNSQKITLNSFQKLQESYLDHIEFYSNTNTVIYPNSDKDQIFTNYHLLIEAMNGHHALALHNRKFYYNVFLDSFEPIYYDGMLRLNKPIKEFNKRIYSKANINQIENYLGKLNDIKIRNNLRKKFNYRVIKEDSIFFNNSIKQVIDNLITIKKTIIEKPQLKNAEILKRNNKNIYFQNHKKSKLTQSFIENIKFNGELYEVQIRPIFSKDIENMKLSSDELAEVLSKNQYANKRIVFLPKIKVSENQNLKRSELKMISFNNGQIIHSKNLILEILKNEKKIKIIQSSPQDWILFSKIDLSGWKVFFKGRKNDSKESSEERINSFGMTGCVNFFSSNLNNIFIDLEKGQCEDTLNIINSFGKIKYIKVQSAYSDALDIDFSKIDINEIEISNAKNDCIDLSGGEYMIINSNLSYCGDKAISVGEKSNLILKKVLISDAKIGVASKDSSMTKIKNIDIRNTELCLSAYNKKQEFYGGLIEVENIVCENYLIINDTDKVSKIIKKN